MTATPKANAIPKTPMPSCGIEALRSALPQPMNTNQNVPIASAVSRCIICASTRDVCMSRTMPVGAKKRKPRNVSGQ